MHCPDCGGKLQVISENVYYCSECKCANILNGVTSIGDFAFLGSSELRKITIPDSVTSIGTAAFMNCTGLSSITLPSSVKTIGNMAFYNCSALKNLTIPSSVTEIGSYAFHGCTGLAEITVPSGIEVNATAFEDCDNIKTAILPEKYIKLLNAPNLQKVVITGGNSKNPSKFANCFMLTGITIPNRVTGVYYSTFKNYDNKTLPALPADTVKYIDATNPQAVFITSADGIDQAEFTNYYKLSAVTIADGITSIGDNAFRNCENLATVTIPSSVKSIGDYAFHGCPKLAKIIFTGTEDEWEALANEDSRDSTTGDFFVKCSDGIIFRL